MNVIRKVARWRGLVLLATLSVVALAGASANAQGYPAKPIKIVVGITVGGTTDTLARLVAQRLSEDLGQPVIVDNRPGASGTIAAEAVAKSAADGYTLLFVNTAHSVNQALYGDALRYDTLKDFTPIGQLSTGPSILVASPSFPGKTAKDVIAMAKAKPNSLDFAIGGTGTSVHMAGELFKSMAGVEIVNIPYKGTGPAMADVLGGQVQLMFAPVITAVPQVKAGKLKALGVTSPAPIPALPDVPPISASLPGYECAAYFGLLGPAKLPANIVKRLNESVAKLAKSKNLKDQLEPDGARTLGGTPEEFSAFLVADVEKWRKVVKATGAKPE